jgi:hypothetical protein
MSLTLIIEDEEKETIEIYLKAYSYRNVLSDFDEILRQALKYNFPNKFIPSNIEELHTTEERVEAILEQVRHNFKNCIYEAGLTSEDY